MAPRRDTPDAPHPDAPSGKAAKYALVERERRFLLQAVPRGTPIARVLIEDRYLVGTRMRLRRMTDLEAPEERAIYKLTQKIPTATGNPGLITTMYLSSAEYAALLDVAAHILRKIRSYFPTMGVDVFEGPLHGLVLAEAEFVSAAEQANFPLPASAVAEVTEDVRFTGGVLVTQAAAETRALLAEFGIRT
jgi:CYTH domain-containing protein